jgi:hypothetical protein
MIPQSDENLSMTTPKLSARRLSKAFGPVTVLQDVDVHFFARTYHRYSHRELVGCITPHGRLQV